MIYEVCMEQLKMALVGAGIIGGVHARALYENEKIHFAAVVDIKKELADALAAKYGCRSYGSIESCLEHEDIDAVDICVTEDHHVAPAVAAAAAQKHILLEKPVAKTTAEALEIVEAAKQNNVRLMVAHLLHFDARYGLLLDMVRRGELGDVSSVYVKRCNTISTCERIGGKVSFMYYLGVHDIEVMCACAGGRPTRVYAQFPGKVCGPLGDDDGVYAIVNFDNGVVGNVEINWAYGKAMPMPVWSYASVVGTRGSGIVEAGPQGLTTCTGEGYSLPDTMLSPVFNGALQGDLALEIDHFASQVLNGGAFAVNNTTPVDAVRVIEACFRCKETGLPVDIAY